MNAPIILADDLTGACEVAALGFRRGLKSVVSLETAPALDGADLLVIDTETRTDDASAASVKIKTIAAGLAETSVRRLYKKTDSVLRGPVNAELSALARVCQIDRVLLVPGNPAMGRVLREGRYTIDGVPLHQSEFANDPFHPARSADVGESLAEPGLLPIHPTAPGVDSLPEQGLILGDSVSTDDLVKWVARLPANTLPAGGAAFCDALLDRWVGPATPPDQPPAFPEGRTLLISGTLSARQRQDLRKARAQGLPAATRPADALDAPGLQGFADDTLSLLSLHGRVIVFVEDAGSGKAVEPSSVSAALGKLTAELVRREALDQLIIEGGATAAAIARQLGWERLTVLAEWAPGTVSLQPEAADAPTLTLKPGSYPWPQVIARALFALHQPSAS